MRLFYSSFYIILLFYNKGSDFMKLLIHKSLNYLNVCVFCPLLIRIKNMNELERIRQEKMNQIKEKEESSEIKTTNKKAIEETLLA